MHDHEIAIERKITSYMNNIEFIVNKRLLENSEPDQFYYLELLVVKPEFLAKMLSEITNEYNISKSKAVSDRFNALIKYLWGLTKSRNKDWEAVVILYHIIGVLPLELSQKDLNIFSKNKDKWRSVRKNLDLLYISEYVLDEYNRSMGSYMDTSPKSSKSRLKVK